LAVSWVLVAVSTQRLPAPHWRAEHGSARQVPLKHTWPVLHGLAALQGGVGMHLKQPSAASRPHE
jgi:hypothetical protein